jgi:AMP-polyphosphate phosphotransferase
MGRLDELDLSQKLSKEEEAERLEAGWKRLEVLRLALGGKLPGHGNGPPVCILFEGWDASGKGGAIKRLVRPFDLRHVRVAQFAAPTPDEKRHHYLRRFWPVLPGRGGMTVLDRSWYGECSSNASRATPPSGNGGAPTGRSSSSSASWPTTE